VTPAQPATPVVCGVDVGSTNVKVVAVAADGRVVARANRETPRHATEMSIDALELVGLVEDMLVEVAAQGVLVHAIASAGVGEDGVLLGADAEPLDRALAWFDPRRPRVFASFRQSLTEPSGLGVATDASRTIVGWRWARERVGASRPIAWSALADFPATHWTATPFMSDTIAARTAAWDVGSRDWIRGNVEATLGDLELLPPVLPAGSIVGPLVSDRLSGAGVLAPDAVAVAGGHDHPLGGFAVDRVTAGAVLDSMGTAEVVVAQARRSVARTALVDVAPGIDQPGSSLLSVAELGRNVAWASLDPDVRAEIQTIIAGDVEPDGFVESDAFVPGERGGGRPRYATTAPGSSRSRASAVLGALARTGNASVTAVADEVGGSAPVFAAGGWARSPGWMRLKARLGVAARVVEEPEVTAVGAALIAAAAIGWDVDAATALSAPRTRS
jgi:sugar (pentulose or hexulose) kinase